MTLTNLKKAVASMMNKSVADLTVDSQDLFLVAVNQVRRVAELAHDFEFSRKTCSVSVDGSTGGSLTSAVEYGTVTAVDIKTIIDVGLVDDLGNLRPVEWTTVAESLERDRVDNPFTMPRYPSDGWARSGPAGGSRFTFSGNSVYRWPKDETSTSTTWTLVFEAYTMLADWATVDTTEDTWLKYGSKYLMYGTICELNHRFGTFVYRQEGNLAPPDKMRDEGLAALIEWDTAKFEAFRRHGR